MTDSRSNLHPDSDLNPSLNSKAITTAVANLYDTYPFPPEPILDEAPPGYNWRWSWEAAYGFCTGGLVPSQKTPRILDAGCGSGVSTEYLAHLNPEADIVAVDISAGTLAVAKERAARTCATRPGHLEFHQISLYDLEQLPGQFDLINCVGVLHHMADPARGIQALANKLAEGGILHIFVYAEIGRWEISLVQKAIALLNRAEAVEQGSSLNIDLKQSLKVGRALFAALPESNRLVQREKSRWQMENTRDECFADMYLHPHEIDYNIDALFELISASGLEFLGFSNPQIWSLERLLEKDPGLLERGRALPVVQQYRLIELLDTDIAHYEFFLGRPPIKQADWSLDHTLLSAIPRRHPCIDGWESKCLFDPDYSVCNLSESEFGFMKLSNDDLNVAEVLTQCSDQCLDANLDTARSLLKQRLILLRY